MIQTRGIGVVCSTCGCEIQETPDNNDAYKTWKVISHVNDPSQCVQGLKSRVDMLVDRIIQLEQASFAIINIF